MIQICYISQADHSSLMYGTLRVSFLNPLMVVRAVGGFVVSILDIPQVS